MRTLRLRYGKDIPSSRGTIWLCHCLPHAGLVRPPLGNRAGVIQACHHRDEMWEFGFTPQSGEQGILDLTGVGQILGEFHTSSTLLESLRGATGVPLLSGS